MFLYILIAVGAYILLGGIYVWSLRKIYARRPAWEPRSDDTWFMRVFLEPDVRAGLCWPIPVVAMTVTAVIVVVVTSIAAVLNGFKFTN
ncbi:MAG: hypothetical protein AMXMBFR44_2480 [Candidatus Campbellbacteria bacterium]